jgi:hypothetical protein
MKRGSSCQDKPTLHLGEHHLLHGKMANLAKPYAVIRRALALVPEGTAGEVEGDAVKIKAKARKKRRKTKTKPPYSPTSYRLHRRNRSIHHRVHLVYTLQALLRIIRPNLIFQVRQCLTLRNGT